MYVPHSTFNTNEVDTNNLKNRKQKIQQNDYCVVGEKSESGKGKYKK